jgi:hypothetical protein
MARLSPPRSFRSSKGLRIESPVPIAICRIVCAAHHKVHRSMPSSICVPSQAPYNAFRPLEPLPGTTMKEIRLAGLGVLLLLGVSAFLMAQGSEQPQAESDRQTVDCMVGGVTREDKIHIALLSASHDFDSIRQIFGRIYPQCAARADQSDRKEILLRDAWRTLSHDVEFKRMREASPVIASTGQ